MHSPSPSGSHPESRSPSESESHHSLPPDSFPQTLRPGFANNPLANYLQRPNPAFAWKELHRVQRTSGMWQVALELTSQEWRGLAWRHQLELLLPKSPVESAHRLALMLVTGSYDGGGAVDLLEELVRSTGQLGAVLYDVPNQPLLGGRVEDQIIAYTFARYLESGDETWPLLFPMVTSARAAMTAIQQITRAEEMPFDRFLLTGASKRGWTTWLTGACDERVAAIAPMVYNNLNLPAQMRRQVESFGGYSEQIDDYAREGVLAQNETPLGRRLSWMVDPYSFRESLSLPKLLLHGANDRYWTLDATALYFDDLPGPRWLLTVPNAGHDLGDRTRAKASLAAFHHAVARHQELPSIQASFSGHNWDCTLSVASDTPPVAIRAWIATAPGSDFRDSLWTPHELGSSQRESFTTRLMATGRLACFAEGEFLLDGRRCYLSSSVAILPSVPAERE